MTIQSLVPPACRDRQALRQTLAHLRGRLSYALLALAVMPQVALANLPDVGKPPKGGGGDGLISTLKGWGATVVWLGALAIAAVAFLVVATSSVGKFREAQRKGEWGDFGFTAAIGVALIVVVIWLGQEAIKIL